MSIPVTSRLKLYTVFYGFSIDEVDSHSKLGHKCMYELFYPHIFLSSLDTVAVAVRISTACFSRGPKTRKL